MWDTWRQATCMPDSCFCEAIHDGVVRQPANSWSSLGFCVAGLVMAVELFRRRDARGLRPVEAATFAVAVFLVGATSAFYHASLTFLGQSLDVQSMYLLALLAVAVNVDALRPGAPRRFGLVYVGLNVVLGVLLLAVPVLRRYAFGLALGSIVVTEVLLRRRTLRDWPLSMLLGAAAVQGVAFFIWVMDLTHTWCAPDSLVQGHAAWHLLGAVASYMLWRYYRGSGQTMSRSAAPVGR
ncbi:MAG: ceramidase domain-containing protein [Myxococcota bacterium]